MVSSERQEDGVQGGLIAEMLSDHEKQMNKNLELLLEDEDMANSQKQRDQSMLDIVPCEESLESSDTKAGRSTMRIQNGVSVGFSDLSYSVPIKPKSKAQAAPTSLTILNSISGSFVAGKISALMGPSGSGKTSLLDCLAGRKNSGEITGKITFNGKKPTPSEFITLVGYVEQFDTLVGELTVEQMLAYTAALKLPSVTTPDERRQRVNEVIDHLDLEVCRDTIIGTTLVRGISGGQAKRVNIGLAMITRPKILFLDEPTSGLDSRTADEVVDLLWQLAREGRAVACTIHSPTGLAFAKFDDLQMLHAGKTIYDGTVNEVQSYFEGLGYSKDTKMSLPEWLVDLTSDAPRQNQTHEYGDGEKRDFSRFFEKSEAKKASIVRRESTMSRMVETGKDLAPPSELSKLWTMLRFRMVAHYKDGEYIGTRFGEKIVFALLILSLYWRIGEKTDTQSIQSTASLLQMVAAICGYGASAFVPSLTLERALYYRELADGCYKPATYYMAKFIEEGILAIITSLVFCIFVYFGCALQGSFFLFVISYYLTTMMGIILAYAVAAVAPTMGAANAILPLLVTIWLFFGGLYIVFDKIPPGWYWFSWSSFLRYSWGAMMLNQFQNEENGEIPVYFDDGETVNVLEFFGLEGFIMGSIGSCLGILCALMGVFSIIGISGLMFIRHDKR